MMSKISPYIETGSPTRCRMKRARNRSTASRHVGFTPDCGRIAATQRTDAMGHELTSYRVGTESLLGELSRVPHLSDLREFLARELR